MNLQFEPTTLEGCTTAKVFFSNGLGALLVKTNDSVEVILLQGTPDDYDVTETSWLETDYPTVLTAIKLMNPD